MFSHVTVGSNDLERSRKFYDALFGAVGAKPGFHDEKGRLVYMHSGAIFIVTPPIDGGSGDPCERRHRWFRHDRRRAGRGVAQGRRRERRHHLRGRARRPAKRLRRTLSRLPARSRRQQALRPSPDGRLAATATSWNACATGPPAAQVVREGSESAAAYRQTSADGPVCSFKQRYLNAELISARRVETCRT